MVDGINAVTKTFASLSPLIFLLFVISQFLAYFTYSNMATIVAVNMGDALEHANLGTIPFMLGFITVTGLVGMLIVGAIPKWALLAPIFVPLFMKLGVAPEAVLAAYRVADSPPNVITPLMPYFALIVTFAQRYDKNAGVGTIIAMMLPYGVAGLGRLDFVVSRLGIARACFWANLTSDQHRLAIETKSKVPFPNTRTPYGRFR
jgi:aminobenzoyl-glutamate transport protein